MLSVGLKLNDKALHELADKLIPALDTTDILDEASAILLNRIRTRFLAETDPEGKPWVQSQAAKRRREKGGTGTLFATGRLFRSIQLHSVGPDSRAISTDVPYAKVPQLGLAGQEKRVYLGFVDEDARLVERLLEIRVGKVM